MRIRLGYVAVALGLNGVTTSSTLTYARYSKIVSEEKRLNELKRVTLSNIDALYEIIKYNIDKNIHFYRITSKLVPLATHPEVLWDFKKYFQVDFKRVGQLIKSYNMRVDSHPDQFNVLNSLRPEVVKKTIIDLRHHVKVFELLGLDCNESKMIIHVGSGQGGKELAKERFILNFNKLSKAIKDRIIIENDDKIFNVDDVIDISKVVNIPTVLDIHHHNCNPCENLQYKLEDVIKSWKDEKLPIKVHLSSPIENEKDKRKHADYINTKDFFQLVHLFRPYDVDFDIMLECKKKDLALDRLVKDIKEQRPNWKWVDYSTLEI